MQSAIIFISIFLVLISVPSGSPQGLAIFSQAADSNQPDTQPSVQLIFRNIGLGPVMDPIFNTLRRRWNSIRANPLIQALLVQPVVPASASASGSTNNIVRRYIRSADVKNVVNHRTSRRHFPEEENMV